MGTLDAVGYLGVTREVATGHNHEHYAVPGSFDFQGRRDVDWLVAHSGQRGGAGLLNHQAV